jgi:hypothetical protein
VQPPADPSTLEEGSETVTPMSAGADARQPANPQSAPAETVAESAEGGEAEPAPEAQPAAEPAPEAQPAAAQEPAPAAADPAPAAQETAPAAEEPAPAAEEPAPTDADAGEAVAAGAAGETSEQTTPESS